MDNYFNDRSTWNYREWEIEHAVCKDSDNIKADSVFVYWTVESAPPECMHQAECLAFDNAFEAACMLKHYILRNAVCDLDFDATEDSLSAEPLELIKLIPDASEETVTLVKECCDALDNITADNDGKLLLYPAINKLNEFFGTIGWVWHKVEFLCDKESVLRLAASKYPLDAFDFVDMMELFHQAYENFVGNDAIVMDGVQHAFQSLHSDFF